MINKGMPRRRSKKKSKDRLFKRSRASKDIEIKRRIKKKKSSKGSFMVPPLPSVLHLLLVDFVEI
jgi:hypothetical protein